MENRGYKINQAELAARAFGSDKTAHQPRVTTERDGQLRFDVVYWRKNINDDEIEYIFERMFYAHKGWHRVRFGLKHEQLDKIDKNFVRMKTTFPHSRTHARVRIRPQIKKPGFWAHLFSR